MGALLLTPGGQALVGFIGGSLAPGAAGVSLSVAGGTISGTQVVIEEPHVQSSHFQAGTTRIEQSCSTSESS
jgi:hypothetical protein